MLLKEDQQTQVAKFISRFDSGIITKVLPNLDVFSWWQIRLTYRNESKKKLLKRFIQNFDENQLKALFNNIWSQKPTDNKLSLSQENNFRRYLIEHFTPLERDSFFSIVEDEPPKDKNEDKAQILIERVISHGKLEKLFDLCWSELDYAKPGDLSLKIQLLNIVFDKQQERRSCIIIIIIGILLLTIISSFFYNYSNDLFILFPSPTPTYTITPTATDTSTPTSTPSQTSTPPQTATETSTPSKTSIPSPAATDTSTLTSTPSHTATSTSSPTKTPSPTNTIVATSQTLTEPSAPTRTPTPPTPSSTPIPPQPPEEPIPDPTNPPDPTDEPPIT